MRDYNERRFMENLRREEEENKKMRANRFERIVCITAITALVGLGAFAIKGCSKCEPTGYTIVNPQYINECITPDVTETVVIVGMSREAILANGWTIVDGPEEPEEETAESEPKYYEYEEGSGKRYYWGKNPNYKNEYETPDVDPMIKFYED